MCDCIWKVSYSIWKTDIHICFLLDNVKILFYSCNLILVIHICTWFWWKAIWYLSNFKIKTAKLWQQFHRYNASVLRIILFLIHTPSRKWRISVTIRTQGGELMTTTGVPFHTSHSSPVCGRNAPFMLLCEHTRRSR